MLGYPKVKKEIKMIRNDLFSVKEERDKLTTWICDDYKNVAVEGKSYKMEKFLCGMGEKAVEEENKSPKD